MARICKHSVLNTSLFDNNLHVIQNLNRRDHAYVYAAVLYVNNCMLRRRYNLIIRELCSKETLLHKITWWFFLIKFLPYCKLLPELLGFKWQILARVTNVLSTDDDPSTVFLDSIFRLWAIKAQLHNNHKFQCGRDLKESSETKLQLKLQS